jgi:hypothetical protein
MGTDNCVVPTTCVNTPGSFTCACNPPAGLCNGVCKDFDTDTANCGGCGVACVGTQDCVLGTCVGTGDLSVTLTWDLAGDMDLHVITPTGKHIYYGLLGPTASTDFGELDVDDQFGTGPENVFWASQYTPPTGNYLVCASPYNINGTTNYTVTIKRPGQPDLVFTGTRTADNISSVCDTLSPNFVTSFAYP